MDTDNKMPAIAGFIFFKKTIDKVDLYCYTVYRVNQVAPVWAKGELKMEKAFNKLIKDYEQYIQHLEELKEVVKPYDGKVYNKRVRDAINSVPTLFIDRDKCIGTTINSNLYKCYVTCLSERRFNADALIKEIDLYISDTYEMLNKLRIESVKLESIIDEYNKKAKESIDFREGLTSHFKELLRYKLDRIYW